MNPETLKAMKARLTKMDRTMSLVKRSDDNMHADAYIRDVTYLRKSVSALLAEVERQAGEIERLKKWRGDVQEREAAVCPEDVPFDEYIRALRTALLPLTSVHIEGSDPNEAVFCARRLMDS
jgi:hypothetical protein